MEVDDSFGQDGKVITDFGNADDEAKAIALQSDDKIIRLEFRFMQALLILL